jgi:hypothetical protein
VAMLLFASDYVVLRISARLFDASASITTAANSNERINFIAAFFVDER